MKKWMFGAAIILFLSYSAMWIVVALFGKMRELALNPVEAGFKSKLGYVVFLPSLERERLALVILRDMKLVIHNKYVKSSLKKQNFGVHL